MKSSGSKRRYLLVLGFLLVLALLFSLAASLVQSDFGGVDVSIMEIEDDEGNIISGKLYRPEGATSGSPASAALLLHGLNNDKDTEAPTAIELSRRGIVVLAIDEFNHGDSDSPANVLEGTEYPDLGAITAFDHLAGLEYVDASSIALVGHSMGGFSANATAEARPSHRAIVFQAFGPLNLSVHDYFNNYLQIWPRFEESSFESRETWIEDGSDMVRYNLDQAGFSPASPVYGTTYGSFSSGTAQRYALIDSTHPGGTWQDESVTEVVAWLQQALDGEAEAEAYEDASSHVYYLKELATLLALILSIVAVVPLVYYLLELEFFESISQEPPKEAYYHGADWWKLSTINSFIGGVTFVLLPFVGVLLFGALNQFVPVFNLMIGNAFLFWFLVNAAIAAFVHRRWKGRQENLTLDQLGGVDKSEEARMEIIAKSLLLAVAAFTMLYILTFLVEILFAIELRYMWAFFRVLTPARFLTFVIYALMVSPFFLINGGAFLFGQARPVVEGDSMVDLMRWWLLNVHTMLSAIILVYAVEYFPMFLLGTGPLLGNVLGIFWLLGIFLMQVIPEFIALFLLLTILYRRTGRYYVGSFLATIIVTWVMVNGAFA